ncbi:unnamed protein product [Trifolium pratense]|uniref:Uncharacterized protein n=1 Tax=Trifolium pratense TaxID=57577 RepID=A0ACB0IVM7_TRIPR|nr:unnamed protein product [Trifolium pratense]
MECLPYFMYDHSQPDDSCCLAFQSIVANDARCICDTIERDNLSKDVTKTMKLPTICGVSLPCHYNALGPYPSEAVSGPSNAPNSPLSRPENDDDDDDIII